MKKPEKSDYIAIGRIIKARGIRGEVKVYPLTDRMERFFELENVFIEKENVPAFSATITRVNESSGQIVLKFEEINDRSAAEDLKGSYVSIEKSELYELEDDSFFAFDIQGLDVVSENGERIGRVKEVMEYPANDVLLIETEDKQVLLPATREYVPAVDIEQKTITVIMPEGLPDYPKGTF